MAAQYYPEHHLGLMLYMGVKTRLACIVYEVNDFSTENLAQVMYKVKVKEVKRLRALGSEKERKPLISFTIDSMRISKKVKDSLQ